MARCGRPFDEAVFQRAVVANLGGASILEVPICSPEDSIISKLEWYRRGGEISERQWQDVTTLTKLLGDASDQQYLRSAAVDVGVSDLLEQLWAERTG